MKHIDQTQFGDRGDCFAACLASILELQIDEVPDLTPVVTDDKAEMKNDQVARANKWLAKFGLFFLETRIAINDTPAVVLKDSGFCVITGNGPRGLDHCVVGHRGRIMFDPHPSRDGLVEHPVYWQFGFLIPLDPRRNGKVAE